MIQDRAVLTMLFLLLSYA